jgi:hypothetical protein
MISLGLWHPHMVLGQILDQLEQWADEKVIFAGKPWSQASEAELGELDASYRVPQSVLDRGLEYFLEVAVAKEVLAVFDGRPQPSVSKRRDLIIYYAENDAHPGWAYLD